MSNETDDTDVPDEGEEDPFPLNGSGAREGDADEQPDRPTEQQQQPRGEDEDEAPAIDDLGSDVEFEAEIADEEEIDEDDLLGGLRIDSTAEIEVPDRLVDQVIGQEHARDVVLKAAKQRRHVMMIGSPGTGKSMLAKAMAELLPKEELEDVLVYHNPDDGNEPKIRTVPAGKGEQIIDAHKEEAQKRDQLRSLLMWIVIAVVAGYAILAMGNPILAVIGAGVIYFVFRYASRGSDAMIPNLLVNNADIKTAPFEDATGAHAGALLGDVRHDPFQSGGMETPSHDRV
ncbi:MAG: ATP-binding protein, partial [Halolamina sp.]